MLLTMESAEYGSTPTSIPNNKAVPLYMYACIESTMCVPASAGCGIYTCSLQLFELGQRRPISQVRLERKGRQLVTFCHHVIMDEFEVQVSLRRVRLPARCCTQSPLKLWWHASILHACFVRATHTR